MLLEQGKEDAKEGGSKDASLLYSALDVRGVGHAALVLDGFLHVIMEGSDKPLQFWEDVEEPFPADQVEGLGQVYEGYVEGLVLLSEFLLKLT